MNTTVYILILLALSQIGTNVKGDDVTISTVVCEAGSYKNDDIGCIACPVGKFTNQVNSQACVACPINTWNGQEGQVVCNNCDDNKNTGGLIGSTTDEMCVTDSEDTDANGIEDNEDTDANGIEDNEDTDANGIEDSEDDDDKDYDDDAKDYDDDDKDYDDDYDVTCERGYYMIRQGTCDICRAGTFTDTVNADVCTKCQADTVSEAGQERCTQCPSDMSTGGETGQSICVARSVSQVPQDVDNSLSNDILPSDWVNCEPGTYANLVIETCSNCPSGSQTHVMNAEECQPCKENTYSQNVRSTTCEYCPKGESTVGATGSDFCYPDCLIPCVNGNVTCDCSENDKVTPDFEKVLYSCINSESGWDFITGICSMSERDLEMYAESGSKTFTNSSDYEDMSSGNIVTLAFAAMHLVFI